MVFESFGVQGPKVKETNQPYNTPPKHTSIFHSPQALKRSTSSWMRGIKSQCQGTNQKVLQSQCQGTNQKVLPVTLNPKL